MSLRLERMMPRSRLNILGIAMLILLLPTLPSILATSLVSQPSPFSLNMPDQVATVTSTGTTTATVTQGDTNKEATYNNIGGNYIYAYDKFTISGPMTFTRYYWYSYVTGSGNVQFGIYTDNSGSSVGGSLVSGSDTGSVSANQGTGWWSITLSSPCYLAAGTYWLGVATNILQSYGWQATLTGTPLRYRSNWTYITSFPSTFPSAGQGTLARTASFYISGVQIKTYPITTTVTSTTVTSSSNPSTVTATTTQATTSSTSTVLSTTISPSTQTVTSTVPSTVTATTTQATTSTVDVTLSPSTVFLTTISPSTQTVTSTVSSTISPSTVTTVSSDTTTVDVTLSPSTVFSTISTMTETTTQAVTYIVTSGVQVVTVTSLGQTVYVVTSTTVYSATDTLNYVIITQTTLTVTSIVSSTTTITGTTTTTSGTTTETITSNSTLT